MCADGGTILACSTSEDTQWRFKWWLTMKPAMRRSRRIGLILANATQLLPLKPPCHHS